MKKGHAAILLFLLALFGALIIIPLFQKGTFIDGLLYKTVAMNAAESGNFWRMQFTETSMPEFCEQPPLYFSALAAYYRIAGTSLFADRIFTVLLLVITLWLAWFLLRRAYQFPAFVFFLFAFFFACVPVICWSHVNQVIEPMVNVLVLSAILFFCLYADRRKTWMMIVFCAHLLPLFLTKGFQSCFIAVLPLFYHLLTGEPARLIKWLVIIVTTFALPLLLLYFYHPGANRWFSCYFDSRLVLTMNNVGSTTDSHAEIIGRFFSELIAALLISAFMILYMNLRERTPVRTLLFSFRQNKIAMALLCTSFAGSFPFALSLVQRGFYLLPAFICFILSLLIGFSPAWLRVSVRVQQALDKRWITVIAAVILTSVIFLGAFTIRDHKRDELLLQDVSQLMTELPQGAHVYVEPALWNDFSLHAYLFAGRKVSLSGDSTLTYSIMGSREKSMSGNVLVTPGNKKYFLRKKFSRSGK